MFSGPEATRNVFFITSKTYVRTSSYICSRIADSISVFSMNHPKARRLYSLSDCSFFQTADKFFEGLRNRRRHFLGNFLCSVRVAGVDKIKQDQGISSFRKLQERRNSEVGGQSWRRGWGEKVLAQVLILLWFEQFYSMAAKRDIYYSVWKQIASYQPVLDSTSSLLQSKFFFSHIFFFN